MSVHLSEASVIHLDTSAASSILASFYTTANHLSTVLWFNPTTAQLLAHSLHSRMGEKIRRVSVRKLVKVEIKTVQ